MDSVIKKVASEPFYLFFPLGVVCAILAVAYWPAVLILKWHLPTFVHSKLMIFGFFGSFIIGFLSTAVPRLTQTNHLSLLELYWLFCSQVGLLCSIVLLNPLVIGAFVFLTYGSLIVILSARIKQTKRIPPPTFIYLPFAFISLFVGVFGEIFLKNNSLFFSQQLIAEGFTLLLICGVGGFLIRSIVGMGPIVLTPTDLLSDQGFPLRGYFIHGLVGLGILLSYFLEYHALFIIAKSLRFLLVAWIFFFQIGINQKVSTQKVTSLTLKISLWVLLLGLGLSICKNPLVNLALLHIIFVGGFAVVTFSVATRVIFSHCGHEALLKGIYRPFSVAMFFIFSSMCFRVSVVFFPQYYVQLIHYASSFWVLGICIWSVFVLGKFIPRVSTKL